MMQNEKPAVYPQPDQPIIATETSSDLEHKVGQVRRRLQNMLGSTLHGVHSSVDAVIRTEQNVEHRLGSLKSQGESLAPNGLYVGVLTLAGLVFTRHRTFPIRWIVPPTVFALSMSYFLPKTTENTVEYYEKIEKQKCPAFAEKRSAGWERVKRFFETGASHFQSTTMMAKDKIVAGIQSLDRSSSSAQPLTQPSSKLI
ncbi:hypothetical protein MVES1_002064 [Malassezia vespertilionis]|uniref:uncharacterized protein n=1 Tax=Malassezia vespertilionis TaxID=2020962 RepID=UPI0024B06B12|nr:uncharacterized protein MVES1_002064 [Malassezia vespertilionis]WFD06710.1 hypothetical protein MVES1_002064 [Malassezia vespertilionis]